MGLKSTSRYVFAVRRSQKSVMWPPYMISPKRYRRSSHGTVALSSRYEKSTLAQILRSPVLKLYFRLQPCWPKRRRPSTIEWNQLRENRHALNSVGLVHASTRSWLKLNHARVRFDLISAGASFATLMHDWSSDSGMFFMYAKPGGSALMKQRKSWCAFIEQTSSLRSSDGSHDCMRWRFWSMTHPPLSDIFSSVASAGFS
mmetsp:Transcript_4421/g.9355  ORF Transcript_4421/g.9355 Transcript_4421/m.9355 type:complete len:201 (-) Transcript_4421:10949-11551(-)